MSVCAVLFRVVTRSLSATTQKNRLHRTTKCEYTTHTFAGSFHFCGAHTKNVFRNERATKKLDRTAQEQQICVRLINVMRVFL